MCFSPQADVVGGLVICAIGIDAVRHVRQRREFPRWHGSPCCESCPYHLSYDIRVTDGLLIVVLYVVAVCGALLISGTATSLSSAPSTSLPSSSLPGSLFPGSLLSGVRR
jgi:hypothetical protein